MTWSPRALYMQANSLRASNCLCSLYRMPYCLLSWLSANSRVCSAGLISLSAHYTVMQRQRYCCDIDDLYGTDLTVTVSAVLYCHAKKHLTSWVFRFCYFSTVCTIISPSNCPWATFNPWIFTEFPSERNSFLKRHVMYLFSFKQS